MNDAPTDGLLPVSPDEFPPESRYQWRCAKCGGLSAVLPLRGTDEHDRYRLAPCYTCSKSGALVTYVREKRR